VKVVLSVLYLELFVNAFAFLAKQQKTWTKSVAKRTPSLFVSAVSMVTYQFWWHSLVCCGVLSGFHGWRHSLWCSVAVSPTSVAFFFFDK
jgi:hypothetical protein